MFWWIKWGYIFIVLERRCEKIFFFILDKDDKKKNLFEVLEEGIDFEEIIMFVFDYILIYLKEEIKYLYLELIIMEFKMVFNYMMF